MPLLLGIKAKKTIPLTRIELEMVKSNLDFSNFILWNNFILKTIIFRLPSLPIIRFIFIGHYNRSPSGQVSGQSGDTVRSELIIYFSHLKAHILSFRYEKSDRISNGER